MTEDATHETVDRSLGVTEMTVDEASTELLQLLPGDTDLEEGEEEIVDAQGDGEKSEGAGEAAGKEGKDAEGDAAEDKADDGETQDDETDPEGEEVEVFVVPVAGGGEEEVTLEELAAGYSRQSDYTRKTQQLADDRRAVEGELAETRTVRGEYAERVKLLNKTLDDMTPEIDWEQVKRDDPENYATRYTDHQRQEVKRQTLKTEADRVEQEDVADRAQQHAVLLAEEKTLLFKAMPDLADPEKSKALITELADYAESQFGVDRGQFDNVENHLIMLLLNDSMKLKKLQSKTQTIKQKVIKGKRVVRPGSQPSGSTVRRKTVRRAKNAYEKLAKTGDVQHAADLFLGLED